MNDIEPKDVQHEYEAENNQIMTQNNWEKDRKENVKEGEWDEERQKEEERW